MNRENLLSVRFEKILDKRLNHLLQYYRCYPCQLQDVKNLRFTNNSWRWRLVVGKIHKKEYVHVYYKFDSYAFGTPRF